MIDNSRLVWSSDEGDLRKKSEGKKARIRPAGNAPVDEAGLLLKVRRLTAGKGRTVIEITGLPANAAWCRELASGLKSALGVGGAFKENYIEIHGEKIDQVTAFLTSRSLKWKKTGG